MSEFKVLPLVTDACSALYCEESSLCLPVPCSMEKTMEAAQDFPYHPMQLLTVNAYKSLWVNFSKTMQDLEEMLEMTFNFIIPFLRMLFFRCVCVVRTCMFLCWSILPVALTQMSFETQRRRLFQKCCCSIITRILKMFFGQIEPNLKFGPTFSEMWDPSTNMGANLVYDCFSH